MLHEQIKKEMTAAMKAKDAPRLKALRNMVASFTNEAVAKEKTPAGILTDEEALAVLQRLAKQRKESIEQFEKGGRKELAQEEREELSYIETYLPQMMSEDEIRAAVSLKKETLGIVDRTKTGILIGAVMKDLKGRADGALVKKIVDEVLNLN